jgi:hypothetical protein
VNEIDTWHSFIEAKPTFTDVVSSALRFLQERLTDDPVPDGDDTGKLTWRLAFANIIDCDDILTLAHHDRHWGALKLLRSLFEKTATLKYIEKNPSEAQSFFDYDAIDWKTAMDAIQKQSGLTMKPDSRAKLDLAAAAARQRFRLDLCPTCRKPSRAFSWTPKSLEEISRITKLDYMYFSAWVLPTKLIHPTFFGLDTLIEPPPMFDTLRSCHSLLVETFAAYERHFHPRDEALVSSVVDDFFRIWVISPTDFSN